MVLICLSIFCVQLSAEEIASEDPKDYPRPIFDLRGPAGRVRSLVFATSPDRLYVAGETKVVDTYFLSSIASSINPSETHPKATFAGTIRWERGRDLYGRVNALAVSEPGGHLAIGGLSLRNSGGDIALFNTERHAAIGVLPFTDVISEPKLERDRSRENGHQAEVVSLDYSPSGQQMISVDAYGETFLWNTSHPNAPILESRRLRPAHPGPHVGTVQKAILISDRISVVCQPVNHDAADSEWCVKYFDLSQDLNGSGTVLATRPGMVADLCRNQSGDFFAAASYDVKAGITTVIVWKAGQPGRLLPEVNTLTSVRLAFGPDARLAVSGININGIPEIRIFDCHKMKHLSSLQEERNVGPARVLAVSNDGKFAARDSAFRNAVLVYRLPADLSEPVLASPQSLEIRSHATMFHKAWVSDDDNYLLAFSESATAAGPDEADCYFDLKTMKVRYRDRRLRRTQWKADSMLPSTWRFRGNSSSFQIIDDRGREWKFQMSRAQRSTIAMQTFRRSDCPDPFVALGASGTNGIYVYRLRADSNVPELVRYFRDHCGLVTAICVSPDGKRLVSSSADRTIKVWSLDGLAWPTAEARLGAKFRTTADQLLVAEVVPAGIAAMRGVKRQSVIEEITYRVNPEEIQSQNSGNSADIKVALSTVPLEMPLGLRLSGIAEKTWMTPGWEPLVTMCFTEAGDWVAVSPFGYYAASDGDGHELLAWQLNEGRTQPVRIVRAPEMKGIFDQRELLADIVVNGIPQSPHPITQNAEKPFPAQPGELLTRSVEQTPQLQLTRPGPGKLALEGVPVTINARIKLPPSALVSDAVVHLFVNGSSMGTKSLTRSPEGNGVGELTWHMQPKAPFNRIRAVLKTANTPQDSTVFAETVFASNVTAQPITIHSLVVGANGYSGILPPLQFARQDADAIAQALISNNPGRAQGKQVLLLDDDVNRSAIIRELALLKEEISQSEDNQLLIVFLAGHGFEDDGEYYFLPPTVSRLEDIEDHGVPWKEFESLASLPCRKLMIVDTCDSGSVVRGSAAGQAVQRLTDSQMVVIAATSSTAGKPALQTDAGEIQVAREIGNFGHGALTWCILESLGDAAGIPGKADGAGESGSKDGIITLRELAAYVRHRLPALTNEYLETEQKPTIAPHDLLEIDSIPLTEAVL